MINTQNMPYNGGRSELSTIIFGGIRMMNWKKIVETTLSVGVAVAASIIGDRFVAKAAKTITTKDDENNDEPIDVEVNEKPEVEDTEEDEVEETED